MLYLPGAEAFQPPVPKAPQTVAETGLSLSVLTDLLARAMFHRLKVTPQELGEQVSLTRQVVEEVFARMREESFIEVVGPASALDYYFALTARGRGLATEAFGRSRYVGPAPVPLAEYLILQGQQSVRALHPSAAQITEQLSSLVLPRRVIEAIGAAVVSTGTMLLYGPPGNGKSTIASLIRSMLPGRIAVPHALDVNGQTVKFFDGRVHERLSRAAIGAESELAQAVPTMDQRYVLCRRPLVVLGGELTLTDLELVYSDIEGTYVAPPQLKANGGVLVVDDLGRQLVRAEDLLNRWIRPMGTGWDHLVLHTGETLEVPFDAVMVFCTNLDPNQLGDEAFERRIRHKALIPSPTRDEFVEIMRREAETQHLDFVRRTAEEFVDAFYFGAGRVPRGSHAGDILRNLTDFARFAGVRPEMTPERLRAAAEAFFVLDSN